MVGAGLVRRHRGRVAVAGHQVGAADDREGGPDPAADPRVGHVHGAVDQRDVGGASDRRDRAAGAAPAAAVGSPAAAAAGARKLTGTTAVTAGSAAIDSSRPAGISTARPFSSTR